MRNLSGSRYSKENREEQAKQEQAENETPEQARVRQVINGPDRQETTEEQEPMEYNRESATPEERVKVDAVRQLEESDRQLDKLKVIPLPVDVESVEAFNIFTPGSNFMSAFGDFIDGFTDKLNGIKESIVQSVTEFKLGDGSGSTKLMNYARGTTYFSISKRQKLFQVNKLGVYWLEYAEFLKYLTDITSCVDRDVLTPAQEYFAKAINNPSLLTSNTFKPKYQIKDVDAIQKQMGKIFNGPVREKITWGEAFKRNEDVPEFINKLEEVKRNVDTLKPDTVNKAVSILSERANIIAKNVRENNSAYVLNPKQTKHISDILFVCAKYVEMYAVAIQLVYELEQCIDISTKQLS